MEIQLVDGDVPTLADFLESLSIDSDLAARLASSTSLEDFVGKCQWVNLIVRYGFQ